MNIAAPFEEDEGPEVVLRKLMQNKGMTGYCMLNGTGIPVKFQGMDNTKALQLAALVSELAVSTQLFLHQKYLDQPPPESPENQLLTLRLKTKKGEIIIAPEGEFTLVALQQTSQDVVEVKQEEEKKE